MHEMSLYGTSPNRDGYVLISVLFVCLFMLVCLSVSLSVCLEQSEYLVGCYV